MLKSNLAVRVLTAVLIVPPLLLLIFRGPAWGFFGLVCLAGLLAADEFFRMTHSGDVLGRALGILATGTVVSALYWFGSEPKVLVTTLLGVTVFGMLLPLWRVGEISTAALRVTGGVAGPFYAGALLVPLALLRRDGAEYGPEWVVMVLTIAWMGDTGGYIAGRLFGKTPLYPAVSPKKTREGLIGALSGSTLATTLAHFWYLPSLPLLDAICLGAGAGLLGQLGDLAESLLKRSTGIKDSGSIVPGHGGLLDRIDAVLIVGPVVYVYFLWKGWP